jgi:hypothetical protein
MFIQIGSHHAFYRNPLIAMGNFSAFLLCWRFLNRAICSTYSTKYRFYWKNIQIIRIAARFTDERRRDFSSRKVNKIAIYALRSGSKECRLIYFNKFHLRLKMKTNEKQTKAIKIIAN